MNKQIYNINMDVDQWNSQNGGTKIIMGEMIIIVLLSTCFHFSFF